MLEEESDNNSTVRMSENSFAPFSPGGIKFLFNRFSFCTASHNL